MSTTETTYTALRENLAYLFGPLAWTSWSFLNRPAIKAE